jgi:hypothetical protein
MKFKRTDPPIVTSFQPRTVEVTIETQADLDMIRDMYDSVIRIPNVVYYNKYSIRESQWTGEAGKKCTALHQFIDDLYMASHLGVY